MYKGLCVINMKGGVGKTTVAVNLGWFGVANGLKTLVVDLDPQFNASAYLMGEERYEQHINAGNLTALDIFEEHAPFRSPQRPKPTARNMMYRRWVGAGANKGCLDIIPSSLDLAYTLNNPGNKALLLSQFLKRHASHYDLVIIDPPPTDSMATQAAYFASDYVLIPVRPEFLSSVGFPLIRNSIRLFRNQHGRHKLKVIGLVLTNVDRSEFPEEYEKTREATEKFARIQRWPFLSSLEIRASRSYVRGAREGTPIGTTDYARAIVVEEFRGLANHVFEKMGLSR